MFDKLSARSGAQLVLQINAGSLNDPEGQTSTHVCDTGYL